MTILDLSPERESELARKSESESARTLGWRVFAAERKLTAKRDLAALPKREERKRRRDGLPPPEAPGTVTSVTRVPSPRRTLCLALLPGGERIVTTNYFGNLRVSAVADGALMWSVDGHSGGIFGSALALTQLAILDDKIVATAGNSDDFVRTWNADTGEQLCEIKVCGGGVCALSAINRHQFVAGCRCGDIRFYEHERGTGLVQAYRFEDANPRPNVWVVDFAVYGERLASVSCIGEVTVWDLQKGSTVAVISGLGTGSVTSVDMNDSIVVTASHDVPHVRVYSVADNYSCIGATGAFDWVHSDVARSVRILGGGHLLSTSDDRTITISALHSNEVIARMKLDFGPCISAVLPNGSIAVSATSTVSGYRSGITILPAPPAAASLLKAYGELTSGSRSSQDSKRPLLSAY